MLPRLRRPLLVFAVVAVALIVAPATASTPGSGDADARIAAQVAPRGEERAPVGTRGAMSVGRRAATLALRMVGTPYRWGGESPEGGFDCSGLIRWSYGRFGIDLPHNAAALNAVGRPVSRHLLRTGDVLVFSGLGHAGLYLGGGWMVHAPSSGKSVEIVNLTATNYGGRLVGARRVVG
jgi:cell wall-associated NlpC family hydrolase